MLMPGRYISDTSQHCMTISTTKWVTTTNPFVIIYCLPCIQWLLNGQLTSTPWSGTDTLTLPIDPVDTTYGTVYTPVSVTPGVLNELHLSVDYISAGSAGIRLAAFEESAGTYKELGSTIIAGSRGDYKLLFTPTGAEVHLTLVNMSTTQLAFLHLGEAHLLTTTTTTPITVYETVCNEDKDKYRFGYNGQQKNNDWAGIGNNLDFGARIYDSRSAKWYSLDPMQTNFPAWSPYNFGLNNPILLQDPDGREPTKSQAGTAEGFIAFLNNTRTKMGTLKGDKAEDAMLRLGQVGMNWKHLRPEPLTTNPFNNSKDKYIYTKKGGWLDMAHFMFYAGRAYDYKMKKQAAESMLEGKQPKNKIQAENMGQLTHLAKMDPVAEAVQDGYHQEMSDRFAAKHSAYSYEDLPSDKLGAEFGANYFDPNSKLSLGEQLNNYLNELGATNPESAPNYDKIPATDNDIGSTPSETNHTTNPMYTGGSNANQTENTKDMKR